MKSTRLFLHLICIASFSLAYTFSSAQDTYPNGQVKYKGDTVNGECITYYENGTIQSKATLANGVLTGEFTEYFENGKMKRKMNVVSATGRTFRKVTDGDCSEYYEDGTLKGKASMVKGKLNGEFVIYYSKNIMQMKGNYVNGKREGEWITYYENGEVKEKSIFKNDERVQKEGEPKKEGDGSSSADTKYRNGQIMFSGSKVKGEYIEYFPSGQIQSKKTYKNSKANGPYIRYHLHGQVAEKGQYLNGEKNGEWIEYNEDGTVEMKFRIEKGKIVENSMEQGKATEKSK
jgi:antitoxin component YwqK of YwqJK toxin-antitoxin module